MYDSNARSEKRLHERVRANMHFQKSISMLKQTYSLLLPYLSFAFVSAYDRIDAKITSTSYRHSFVLSIEQLNGCVAKMMPVL
jgi:hypothetical protein